MLMVILAHAGLIPGGQWEGDEYFNLAALHHGGFAFFWQRLMGWSPRPISELLVVLYGVSVYFWREPLVMPILLFCWGVLGAGALAGLPPRGASATWRWLVLLALLALFLLRHPVGQLFYWPMAALAYLPSLAGMTCSTLLIVRGIEETQGRRWLCMGMLLLGAGSSEFGAMFVLPLTSLLGLIEIIALRGQSRPWRLRDVARFLWWFAPLALSVVVLFLVMTGRVAAGIEGASGASFHRLLPSLVQGVRSFAVEAGIATPWLLIAAAGLACCLRRAMVGPAQKGPIVSVSCAGLIAACGSTIAAYYNFGELCCERQESFRGCLFVLTAFALAALFASVRTRIWQILPAWAGPALLAVTVMAGFVARAPDLLADYHTLPEQIAVRTANMTSGKSSGPDMVLRMPPPTHVINTVLFPPVGVFSATASPPWYVGGVLAFFDKQHLQIAATP